MVKRYGRFQHLKEAGIVNNWTTLSRWIAAYGFPEPSHPTPGTTLFDLDAVDAWLEARKSTVRKRGA